MRARAFIFALLMSLSGLSHAVTVDFSGTFGNFGGFFAGSDFSGSFEADESVVTSNGRFDAAADNFLLNINGSEFSAENGSIRQSSSRGGSVDQYLVSFLDGFVFRGGEFVQQNNPVGSLSGNVGASELTSLFLAFTGSNLFDDRNLLASGLSRIDFSNTFIVLGFSEITDNGNRRPTLTTTTELATNFATADFDLPTVPVPAAAWLFGTGLIGLFGLTRIRTWKTSRASATA